MQDIDGLLESGLFSDVAKYRRTAVVPTTDNLKSQKWLPSTSVSYTLPENTNFITIKTLLRRTELFKKAIQCGQMFCLFCRSHWAFLSWSTRSWTFSSANVMKSWVEWNGMVAFQKREAAEKDTDNSSSILRWSTENSTNDSEKNNYLKIVSSV